MILMLQYINLVNLGQKTDQSVEKRATRKGNAMKKLISVRASVLILLMVGILLIVPAMQASAQTPWYYVGGQTCGNGAGLYSGIFATMTCPRTSAGARSNVIYVSKNSTNWIAIGWLWNSNGVLTATVQALVNGGNWVRNITGLAPGSTHRFGLRRYSRNVWEYYIDARSMGTKATAFDEGLAACEAQRVKSSSVSNQSSFDSVQTQLMGASWKDASLSAQYDNDPVYNGKVFPGLFYVRPY